VIHFLTTPESADTIRVYLKVAGAGLGGRLAPMTYPELFAARALPTGTYCFADLELLSDVEGARAAQRWQELADRGCRLLNHPTRSLLRLDLLRELRRRGINRFSAYRLTDPADAEQTKQFPVFLRTMNDHKGSLSPLLESPAALRAATENLRLSGARLDDKLVVEFCDTAGPGGVYRKYGAFVVGDRILPRHLFFSPHWVVKDWNLLDETLLREEQDYLATNPHERQLREIFALARIEYGRIDYSFRGDAMQVWEINTNPIIIGMGPSRQSPPAPSGVAARVRAALRPAWSRLTARVPALAALRERVAPPQPAGPARPIPRASIHATFAAMLEPAWAAVDEVSALGSPLASASSPHR
jgi:hypothetical protein